jgi:hypothetical protein
VKRLLAWLFGRKRPSEAERKRFIASFWSEVFDRPLSDDIARPRVVPPTWASDDDIAPLRKSGLL